MGGWDPGCEICGTSPALVPFTEEELKSKVSEDGKVSWMPVDEKEAADFHLNILIIGSFDSEDLFTKNSLSDSEESVDSFTEGSSSWQVCCVVGYDPLKGDFSGGNVKRDRKKDLWFVHGDEENMQGISRRPDTWSKCYLEGCSVSGYNGAFLVHTQCWKLLHAVCKSHFRNLITPKIFFKGASKLYKDKESEEAKSKSKWPHKKLAYDGCGQYVNPLEGLDERYIDEVLEAVKTTEKTGKIDTKLRDDLWEKIGAWLWHPIDRFPLQEAFTVSVASPLIQQESKPASGRSTIENLPLEIIELVLKDLDVPSILSFAATCSKMRKSLLPLRDEVVGPSIQIYHSWMLPKTPAEKRRCDCEVQKATATSQLRAIPWTSYYRLCIESQASMKNRKRIWNNTQQICADLVDQGLLQVKAVDLE